MDRMKPVGSEKLKGDDKIKRIIELSLYKTAPKKQINEVKDVTSIVEHVVSSETGEYYGIVKEKDGYFVKKGLNESSLDYIGGMFMKNKNRFRSYGEALKRLDLLKGQDELYEAKRYVLKKKEVAPPQEETPSFEDEVPMDEPLPQDDSMNDVPMDDTEMGGEESGETEGKPSDYMSEIQKFAGKLGQELRDQKTKLVSDDIKYVLNMIISAVDLKKLDENDLDDVAKKFERDEIEEDGDESYEDEGTDVEDEETDLSEIDMSDELDEFFKTPFDLDDDEEETEIDELDISQYEDLVEDDEVPTKGGFDIEKIKNEINSSVMDILKKYK